MLKSMTDMKSTFKTIFLVAAAALSAAGCTGDGSRAPRMSREEKALIEGPGIMRVLTVDNREDSLVLRAGCSDFRIHDMKSETFRILSGRMIATVTDPSQDGVGIAGPQVGLKRRIVAVMRYDKPGMPFEIYPNLHIEYLSDEKQCGPEGCLSIPDISGNVIRSQKIIIRYTDPETIETVRDTVEGYTAVIFQHEADHLDGILFTDKVVNTGPGR